MEINTKIFLTAMTIFILLSLLAKAKLEEWSPWTKKYVPYWGGLGLVLSIGVMVGCIFVRIWQ